MKNLLSIVIIVLFAIVNINGMCSFGCGDPTMHEPAFPYFYYQNSKGEDLLDSATDGHYKINDITISWVNPDGTSSSMSPYFDKSLSNSNSYLPNGNYFLVDPYQLQDDNKNYGVVRNNTFTFYIHLNNSTTDTVTFDYDENVLEKLSYNKTLINPPNSMKAYPKPTPVIIEK